MFTLSPPPEEKSFFPLVKLDVLVSAVCNLPRDRCGSSFCCFSLESLKLALLFCGFFWHLKRPSVLQIYNLNLSLRLLGSPLHVNWCARFSLCCSSVLWDFTAGLVLQQHFSGECFYNYAGEHVIIISAESEVGWRCGVKHWLWLDARGEHLFSHCK